MWTVEENIFNEIEWNIELSNIIYYNIWTYLIFLYISYLYEAQSDAFSNKTLCLSSPV
jgi:hypothetical protein